MTAMTVTRRNFLAKTAVTAGVGTLAGGVIPFGLPDAAIASEAGLPERILHLFRALPGHVSIKIMAPPHAGRRGLLVEHNPGKRLFIGSAFKTFVLCEALRQADSPTVVNTIASRQLALNASVWSLDSASFNPPYLRGKVSERTAMEAMILHSDNTATDMMLKLAGPDNVRRFIASIGLKSTMIPDSTRIFFGYLFGAKNYKKFTWEDLVAAEKANKPIVNSPLNNVETLASSADDLVSYYSRSLQGAFFKNPETLNQFREILAMGDAIWLVPLPLGVSAFVKGGSIDVPGFHALCVPGAMFFDNRWVYFCLTINWFAPALSDPATVVAFATAASKALQIVKNALSVKC
jgi:beta-lactamase class A